jgi:hypothetical protein
MVAVVDSVGEKHDWRWPKSSFEFRTQMCRQPDAKKERI